MTTFRHLKIFVTVAQCQSMRKAAGVLYISQPTVSQAIRELEETYGVKLFDRLSQRIYITENGRTFLGYAQQILASMDTLEEAMRQANGSPIVRIGASVTVGTVFLGGFLSRLRQAMPALDPRVTVNNTTAIERLVCDSELDFAIVEGRVTSPDLLRYPICQDEIVMVVGRSHPFYPAASISLSQLNGQALISRENGSAERNQFERLMAAQNISMVKKWCCTNTEAIKQAVMDGQGIAILSKKLIEKELANQTLRILPLEGTRILRNFKCIFHKNKVFSPALLQFLEQQRLPQTPADGPGAATGEPPLL